MKIRAFLENRGRMVLIVICAVIMLISFFGLQPWVQANALFRAGAGNGTGAGAETAVLPTPAASGGFQPPAGPSPTPSNSIEISSSSSGGTTGGTNGNGSAGGNAGGGGRAGGGGFFGGGGGGAGGGAFRGAFAGGAGGIISPQLLINVFGNPSILLVPVAALGSLIVGLVGLRLLKRRRLLTKIAVVFGFLALIYFLIDFGRGGALPTGIGFYLAFAATLTLIGQGLTLKPIVNAADAAAQQQIAAMLVSPRRGGLGISQNVGVALDALMANKMRSALTMLGVVIGVTAVVALLSVGQGAQAAVTQQIQGIGTNLLTISSRAGGSARNLTYQDAEAIKAAVSGLTAVLPQYNGNLTVRSDTASTSATVQAVVPEYASVSNIKVAKGHFFTTGEFDAAAHVVVLGTSIASDLFGTADPLGQEVRLNGQRYEVIGVLEQQNATFGADPNEAMYVPLKTAYRNLFTNAKASGSNDDLVSNIRVSVTKVEDIESVKAQIERILRTRHRTKADADNDFNILDQQQLLNTASQVTGILTILLGAIASVSLLVGGIGIMNISLVSVSERTKEIGLRKALGARKNRILQQFLIETVLLSTIGGIIGVLFGVGISVLVTSSGLLTARVTPESIALGLGFSIIVGVFFGVYPATRAASLQPIEALRYE
ncbi:MAG: ABC transporter permease [Anaerolineae bacterium]|nr:ABC transporter permease [Anaerolineae bacterium]